MLRGRANTLARTDVLLSLDGEAAAKVDPECLQSALSDAATMIDGLSDAGRRRLLKLFLTTGASLFRGEAGSGFGRAADGLLQLLGAPTLSPASWCPLGKAGHIVSYRISAGDVATPKGGLVALSDTDVGRIDGFKAFVERTESGDVLHMFLADGWPSGRTLVVLGETPLHLVAPAADVAPQPLSTWVQRRDTATRNWVERLVDASAGSDPVAAALKREMTCGTELAPQLSVAHLSANADGILYALDLSDRHRLINAVRIRRGEAEIVVPTPSGSMPNGTGRTFAGYADLSRRSWIDDSCHIRMEYSSGRLVTVHSGPLEAFTGAVPDVFRPVSAPALAKARMGMTRPSVGVTVEEFGDPRRDPSLSIIVEVGENLDAICARAAMLFREPDASGVELVYYAREGRLADAARNALANAQSVFGLPHLLVTVPSDEVEASRLTAALLEGRADRLLVLGPDVLPAAPRWLNPWIEWNCGERPLLGGTLLAVDGSILDAGEWVRKGRRPRRSCRVAGLPASALPRKPTVLTTRVTAECFGLSRGGLRSLLTDARWYPDTNVMLAQTVDRLGTEGRPAQTLLKSRFIRYGAGREYDPITKAADGLALEIILNASLGCSPQDALPCAS